MGFKPEYQLLYEELLGHIRNGEQAPGTKLLPERKLMDSFKLSRTTVRRALELLERDGLIERRPGFGAIVTRPLTDNAAHKLRIGIDFADDHDQSYQSLLHMELQRYADRGSVELLAKSHQEMLEDDTLDGAIFSAMETVGLMQLEQDFKYRHPVIFFNRMPIHPEMAYFAVDYRAEVSLLVGRLFRNGVKKIALIGGENHPTNARYADYTRMLGWQDACMEHLGEIPYELMINGDLMLNEYKNICDVFRKHRPEAVFVTRSSNMSVTCIMLAQLGLTPGENIDLFCFDNLERFQENFDVAVSYVKMPFNKMVKKAIDYIANAADMDVPKELLRPQVVIDQCRFLI